MTLFFIKRSRLKSGQKSLDFKWSGFQMPGTGIRSNPNTDHGIRFGSVFGGSLYMFYIDPFRLKYFLLSQLNHPIAIYGLSIHKTLKHFALANTP